MEINAILFDKDGTLFDFEASWSAAMVELLDTVAPGETRDDAAEALGFDLGTVAFRPDSIAIAGTLEDMINALAGAVDVARDDLFDIVRLISAEAPMVPVVDLAACLGDLAVSYQLGVVTNDSEAGARRHLDQAGIGDIFGFVAGSDSGFGAKPDPGLVLAGAEALGVPPENCAMVGDSLHDLMAGQAAGMIPVGVLTGVATYDDLAPYATVVLPDIGALDAWIRDGLSDHHAQY